VGNTDFAAAKPETPLPIMATLNGTCKYGLVVKEKSGRDSVGRPVISIPSIVSFVSSILTLSSAFMSVDCLIAIAKLQLRGSRNWGQQTQYLCEKKEDQEYDQEMRQE
jgi:hypothetical protein